MTPILALEQVSKQYPGVVALDGVNFTLERGEVRALLGKNGAGKSTLVKVLSGAVHPDSGVIRIDGQPAAIQIVYRVEAPGWLSAEYINGGVDPACNALSPGSVLTFVNTQSAWEEARALGRALRSSFGRADREYKARCCHSVPVFATG